MEQDLARIARADDVVLVQEAALAPSFSSLLSDAGLRWVMASSFSTIRRTWRHHRFAHFSGSKCVHVPRNPTSRFPNPQ